MTLDASATVTGTGLKLRIPPPSLPPAAVAEASPGFTLAAFRAARVHPNSEPGLVAALERLYQDSASFRILLQSFSQEQPLVAVRLMSEPGPGPGSLVVQPVADSFLVTVRVQTRLERLQLDSAVPWLGAIFQGLLAVTRKGGLRALSQHHYEFARDLRLGMMAYQGQLRAELAVAASEPRLLLAEHWETLYAQRVQPKQGNWHFTPIDNRRRGFVY